MHDDVTSIDQNPVALIDSFDGGILDARLFQLFEKVIGHRDDLPAGRAGSDHHVIGDRRFSVQVDDGDGLCLVVIKRGCDQSQQLVGTRKVRKLGSDSPFLL